MSKVKSRRAKVSMIIAHNSDKVERVDFNVLGEAWSQAVPPAGSQVQ
jgi:hypothetical protein